jgi:hypothetical protein
VDDKTAGVVASANVEGELDLIEWQPLGVACRGQEDISAAMRLDFRFFVTYPVNALGVDELMTCTAIPQGISFFH